MAADVITLCADLAAEHNALDAVVAALAPAAWATPTPAVGWTVHDQVGHLAFFDERAHTAAVDPGAFAAHLSAIAADPAGWSAGHLDQARALDPATLLRRWRRVRSRFIEAAAGLDPATRVAWYGPSMSVASFVTARLMETWCHGQDVRDAVGLPPAAGPRLRHIAHLGVRTRANSYLANGREVPAGVTRVELTAPDGSLWSWGEPGVTDRIAGSALDFCLVVTQRRHRADTDLVITGPLAEEWMSLAQAFAGPPGDGRRAGQFPRASAAAR
ncbi:MAG: TIGR03084 family protein [Chloroflexi bacterium]|nr:MAG: TIGR03084 family protein [Chloroflexota bacterium]